jgi:hypothetical protein
MDKKIVGLAGALAAFGAVPAQAATELSSATPELVAARSFADLLDPIPNALALLQAIDSAKAARSEGAAQSVVQMAEEDEEHHHHHHHHRYYRKPYVPPRPPPRRYYYHHHHHHHHHHHYYENDD